MGILTKASKQEADGGGGGAGFLLVFFPEEQTAPSEKLLPCSPPASSSSASSPSPSSSEAMRLLRRSSSNRLLSKARSTISICALLMFVTLLVFTLSNFETAANSSTPLAVPRRLLTEAGSEGAARPTTIFRLLNIWSPSGFARRRGAAPTKHQFALQGMGTLYRRGTRAMNDLVVAHVTETATDNELRLFLRALHRSGLTARADLALIHCSKSPSFDSVIREENESFLRLLHHYGRLKLNETAGQKSPASLLGFEVSHFTRPAKTKEKEVPEPLWGKRRPSNFREHIEGNVTRFTYGSIVGFEAAELDSESSLAGFLDHAVHMSLRRWSCYQMLLGRVRRNFKHVMLVDVRNIVILRDPLGRVRSRSAEAIHLLGKHDVSGVSSPRQARKAATDRTVNAGLVMGGARGVRRLAAAMLTEIVRAAMQAKKRGSVSDQAVLSQLAGNEHLLKKVELVRAADGPNSEFAVIKQRGNSLGGVIMKQICSSEVDSHVYKDCITSESK
ncbi:hypothetical protein SAY86_007068 [Trapa natans]|uniref:DUF7780 domain-containing protein n=1 Tax=Trapa natans TaxID=22666 RepID=A0AAN7LDW8_TRANT|nr:hypothetical protein SAY86_007068 [Trapa natans]